ncbi:MULTISPECIES: NAD(P)/FAD-dependent oxidoreductase [unclassified Paenibacillus]|uniref:NAD(P)/FAD-dependent oxidoreductase n=1 Tax=unclassified Paenibacillus TaxID=185978 RepID=UPI0009A6ED5F|nr:MULTISPECIES: FAD-binding oxidoreductase [unclassified Paenibacillus]SLK13836.1 Glycine/D-amino acid oxidase [Paenibacillus sp. RU5A]SOC73167.1 Glycine/D-amino acid oxidase [Paenibacillus sp. RU26A]SOC75450.1 Glycine/D-amino acid oxidase [Paenibacillus sp. RU5M]
MDLVYGTPFWPSTFNPNSNYPSLQTDISCDCLIIGGGMGGALTSELLTERGVNTVVIDKRKIAHGSSSANTGLLQYTNDKTLTSCINTFGEKTGVRFYELCREAMQKLTQIADRLDTDPWFIPRTSLCFASSIDDVAMLEEEYQTLKHYGFEAELWNSDKISTHFPFSKPAALYTLGDAEVNPYRFVHALFESASKRGARIYGQTEMIHCEFDDDGVLCHTSGGKIRASKVIFAAGYETQTIKKDQGAYLQTTYAIATKPLPDLKEWYEHSLIWETARPYLYMRTTPDGRIIAGGLDEETPREDQREIRARHRGDTLLEEVRSYFPLEGLEVDYAWGAVFGNTNDGLPFIGPHPEYPHSYFLEGYGGNGTVYSMFAASLLADAVTGVENGDMELFSLTRTSKPSPV